MDVMYCPCDFSSVRFINSIILLTVIAFREAPTIDLCIDFAPFTLHAPQVTRKNQGRQEQEYHQFPLK